MAFAVPAPSVWASTVNATVSAAAQQSARTTIRAVPAVMAVTIPVELTVATAVLVEDQSKLTPLTTSPESSSACAESWSVWSGAVKTWLSWLARTSATVGSVGDSVVAPFTLMLDFTTLPLIFAEAMTAPSPRPCSSPSEDTSATVESLVVYSAPAIG